MRESAIRYLTTHNDYRSPEYHTWSGIKARCYQSSNAAFKHYGARGIEVCDRWLNSYENFLADMGRRPSAKHSIERRNNDGDYEPTNCRWATKVEQARNRRTVKSATINGETLTIPEWAERYDVPSRLITQRIKILGWDAEKAVTTPIRTRRRVP